jgi:hypothetical protein
MPAVNRQSPAYLEQFRSVVKQDNQVNPEAKLVAQLKTILTKAAANVDRIGNLQSTADGKLTGLFKDGRKVFKFTLNTEKETLTYKLLTGKLDSLYRLDAARKKCSVGITCGESCISRNKSCDLGLAAIATHNQILQLKMSAVDFNLSKNKAPETSNTTPPPEAKPKPDYVINPETGEEYTIRELRPIASQKQIHGYSSMTKDELRAALKATDDNPDQQQRIAKTLGKERGLGSRAIKSSGLTGGSRRSATDANRTWKNLNQLAKFAGTAPAGWGVAAAGAFLLGTTIRGYERAKSAYRSNLSEAAQEAQEKAATLGSVKSGAIKRTGPNYNNITFVISAGKGYGSQEMVDQLKSIGEKSEDPAEQWFAKKHFYIPFDLKETGARRNGSDIENAVNGLKDYVQNFKRKKDQDAIDLASQIYAYGIQRTLDSKKALKLKSLKSQHTSLLKEQERRTKEVEKVTQAFEKEKNGARKALKEFELKAARQKLERATRHVRENQHNYLKLESTPDKGTRDLANKGKNINIIAHSRGGQTAKTAMEYLVRMRLPGEPSGKKIAEQVNLVLLGTPHFGFTENVTKRQRTIISAQDPIAQLPVFGEGARQEWISSVPSHNVKDYLNDGRVRESLRETFGFYDDSLLERTRRQVKKNNDSLAYLAERQLILRLDKKLAVCKVGKPCKTESGDVICIPKSHRCGSEVAKHAEVKTNPFQSKKLQRNLAIAGVSVGAIAGVMAGTAAIVQHDLTRSSVPFDTIRQPPGGIPDAETLKKYDTFEPGDLIRKNFKSDRMGNRQHYGVYIGRDPETNEHLCIDTGENWKSRDREPHVKVWGLTWSSDTPENDSEWEKVPAEEMHLVKGTQKFSQEEIVARANKMLYQKFRYEGFESNCEAFARAVVEGKAYSAQGMKVSPLTNFISRVVTDHMISIRDNGNLDIVKQKQLLKQLESQGLGESKEAQNARKSIEGLTNQQKIFGKDKEKVIFKLGDLEITGLNTYAKDPHKLTAKGVADYLERERQFAERRKWEEQINPYDGSRDRGYLQKLAQQESMQRELAFKEKFQAAQVKHKALTKSGNALQLAIAGRKTKVDDVRPDQLCDQLGLKDPEDYSKLVNTVTVGFPGNLSTEIATQMYKNYLMMLFGSLNLPQKSTYTEAFDSAIPNCSKGKPCKTESGDIVCIPKSAKCGSETKVASPAIAGVGVGKLALGAAALTTGAIATHHVASTINIPQLEDSQLSLVNQDFLDGLKVDKSKVISKQGMTSTATFVKDRNGNSYVFKQVSNPLVMAMLQPPSDVVASEIGRNAGINVNKTMLVPAASKFFLKKGILGATLHETVPGESIDSLAEREPDHQFAGIRLSQASGLTPMGIKPSHLKSLALHPDLPKIAALDTFMGNWDRGRSNLFYDKTSNSFHGIDMGVSLSHKPFGASLSQVTKKNFEKADFSKLSPEQIKAADSYLSTLKTLYRDNPPAKIERRLASYNALDNGDWRILGRYAGMKSIQDNHTQAGELIKTLESKLGKRSDAYQETYQLAMKLDKKCGKSGIPDNAVCRIGKSKPSVKSPQHTSSDLTPWVAAGATTAALAVGAIAGSKVTSTLHQAQEEHKQAKVSLSEAQRIREEAQKLKEEADKKAQELEEKQQELAEKEKEYSVASARAKRIKKGKEIAKAGLEGAIASGISSASAGPQAAIVAGAVGGGISALKRASQVVFDDDDYQESLDSVRTWVKESRVKGGGYWRRLGEVANSLSDTPTTHRAKSVDKAINGLQVHSSLNLFKDQKTLTKTLDIFSKDRELSALAIKAPLSHKHKQAFNQKMAQKLMADKDTRDVANKLLKDPQFKQDLGKVFAAAINHIRQGS